MKSLYTGQEKPTSSMLLLPPWQPKEGSLSKIRKEEAKRIVEPLRLVYNKSLLHHDLQSLIQQERILEKQASCSWNVRENQNNLKPNQQL